MSLFRTNPGRALSRSVSACLTSLVWENMENFERPLLDTAQESSFRSNAPTLDAPRSTSAVATLVRCALRAACCHDARGALHRHGRASACLAHPPQRNTRISPSPLPPGCRHATHDRPTRPPNNPQTTALTHSKRPAPLLDPTVPPDRLSTLLASGCTCASAPATGTPAPAPARRHQHQQLAVQVVGLRGRVGST